MRLQNSIRDFMRNYLGITYEADNDELFALYFNDALSGFQGTDEWMGWRRDKDTTIPFGVAQANAINGVASQVMHLTYFRARKTESCTQVTVHSGATAAGATPTLVRFGVYSVNDATGDLTALLASTPNDTTLLAATGTAYPKAFSAPFNKVAGVRYALGILVVTGAAVPNFIGYNIGSGTTSMRNAANALASPRRLAQVTAQADLPASVVNASLTSPSTGGMVYAEFN